MAKAQCWNLLTPISRTCPVTPLWNSKQCHNEAGTVASWWQPQESSHDSILQNFSQSTKQVPFFALYLPIHQNILIWERCYLPACLRVSHSLPEISFLLRSSCWFELSNIWTLIQSYCLSLYSPEPLVYRSSPDSVRNSRMLQDLLGSPSKLLAIGHMSCLLQWRWYGN